MIIMKPGPHARNDGSTRKGMVGLHGQESTDLSKDEMKIIKMK